ncbi:HlyD family type I secretion periplasmic adaptor subunit [Bradyrhizobium acaciae]|uniref:HlyD family type I secretion periplasmic adaptor subunit n=1 Tax=Bradyrhizobium acaciae TaxID=2683706 RepID=UPI001E5D428E|nr:HlyD family type I secretion periplasmic adaptor subunit [Bradyrhizobium acaciae]MCC8980644.1 HlyD family type I secretion periplasmic adaptor subunit [Bradyrhizobium acaciae]
MARIRNVLALRSGTDEREFLPAALEIVETPASPAGRLTGATVIAVFCVALAWAAFGKVDIVASAQGKIVPIGGTKVIQPFETGIVKAIHVHEGQQVKAGDILVEVDPRINQAERDHLVVDYRAARLEVARINAALANADDPLTAFHPPDDASPSEVAVERDYLLKQTAEFRAKIESLSRQLEEKKAARATTQATLEKLAAVVPIIQQRVDIRKTSSEREYTSKYQYLEIYQSLTEAQREVVVQQNHLQEAEASIAALSGSRDQAIAEFQRTLFGQLVEAQRKADGLAHDIEKVQSKINAQYMTSPIDGTVQQLAIHTAGGIVTPAQVLLVIAPANGRIEIEAMVPNKDVGFVHPGQKAQIKIDTFNFTKYGLIHGTVESVSRDAVVREKPRDKSSDQTPGSTNTTSEPAGQQLVFTARVSMDRTEMMIDDREINLSPGMAVTVEIATGARSILSYLLSPLVRYGHDSMRER